MGSVLPAKGAGAACHAAMSSIPLAVSAWLIWSAQWQ